MRTVALPDPVYAEAERAAAASGQSLEEFVLGAVQDRLEEEAPVVLTPEQIAKVQKARESVRAGRVLTPQEVRAKLAQNRDDWIKANPR